jgi:hypothetical protein
MRGPVSTRTEERAVNIPFNVTESGVRGAPAGTPIRLDALRQGDRILAVVKHNAAEGVLEGLDPAAFTVEGCSVRSDVLDTAGCYLAIVHGR